MFERQMFEREKETKKKDVKKRKEQIIMLDVCFHETTD